MPFDPNTAKPITANPTAKGRFNPATAKPVQSATDTKPTAPAQRGYHLGQMGRDYMDTVHQATDSVKNGFAGYTSGVSKLYGDLFKGNFAGAAHEYLPALSHALGFGNAISGALMQPPSGAVHAAVAPLSRATSDTLRDTTGRVMPDISLQSQPGKVLPRIAVNTNLDREQAANSMDRTVGTVGGLASAALGNESALARAGAESRAANATLQASKWEDPAGGVRFGTKAAKVDQAALDADRMRNAGVQPFRAITEPSPLKSNALNVITSNPAGFVARGRVGKAVEQVKTGAQDIAGSYGEPRGNQLAGEGLKEGAQAFTDKFKVTAGQQYDKAFQPILDAEAAQRDTSASQYAEKVAQAHQDAIAASGGAAGASDATLSAIPRGEHLVDVSATKNVLKDISNRITAPQLAKIIGDGGAGKLLSAINGDANALTFTDLRNLRTWVREQQHDSELTQSIGNASKQRLEQALTEDIYGSAQKLGGKEAEANLRNADNFYKTGMTHIQDVLQPLVDKASGEGAYSRVIDMARSGKSADVKGLVATKKSMAPDTWGDVVATTIKNMGKPSAGAAKAGETEEPFSVAQFVTRYNDFSPAARDALFGEAGTPLRTKLDDLAFSASRIKDLERFANSSRTFNHAQLAAMLAGMVNPVTIGPTVAGMAGIAGAGEHLTAPLNAARAVSGGRGLGMSNALPGAGSAARLAAPINAANRALPSSGAISGPKLALPGYTSSLQAKEVDQKDKRKK